MNQLRRNLLKSMAAIPLLPLLGSLLAEAARAAVIPANYILATTAEQTPKVMQYTDDVKKASPPTRADKTAFCNNCSQYGITHKELTHPKDGKVATCEVFLKGNDKMFVKSGGWCLAHQKKKK